MKSRSVTMASYLIALILLADQGSKWMMLKASSPSPHVMPIAPFLNFALVWNRGVTFGMLNHFDHKMMPFLLIAVAAIIILLLGRWLLRTSSRPVAFALSAIIGGAVSNIIDRLRYGAVVDFIDVYYRNYHWYTFNVADAAIVMGVSLLLLDSLIKGR